MENDTIVKVATGVGGVTGTEVIPHIIDAITPATINEGVGLIGQLVIIIATLLQLFKRKKKA